MTMLKSMDLNINEKAIGYARIYSSLIKDEFQRKRAYASIIGIYALIDALEKTDNDIQKNMTLFRNAKLNELYEIADFYINNWHIDVRIAGEGSNVLIPRAHFDNNILPDFYAVIKLDKNLKHAVLIGFADTASINKQPFDYNYYSVELNSLISYEDFLLKINKAKITNFDESEHTKFVNSYLKIVDDEINNEEKLLILKHLFECPECRKDFCCFTGFEMVNSNLGKYPELLDDHTLHIIGAQVVDDEKYKDKEEIINISDETEEPSKTLQTAQTEEAVEDILDELFDEEDKNELTEHEPEQYIDTDTDDSDIQILGEDADKSNDENSLEEVNELLAVHETPDLEIIGDEVIDIPVAGGDVSFIKDAENNEPNNEIKLIDDDSDIQDEPSDYNQNAETQKVIVDYDEYGEPIYSYITNIPPEDEKKADFEAEISDEDLLNEEFETYAPQEYDDSDLSSIKNGGARTIEYVQDENENNSSLDDNIQKAQENNEETENITEASHTDNTEIVYNDLSEEKNTKQEEYKDSYDYTEESNNETSDDDNIIKYHDDESIEPVEEETKSDAEENENYEDSEYSNDAETEETEYSEDSNAEDEEYEEYEDYDEGNKGSKKKTPVLAVLIGIIVLGSILGGFLLFKNISSNKTNTEIAQNNQEIPIAQPNENDAIEIPQNPENAELPPIENLPASENNEIPIEQNSNEMLPPPETQQNPQLTENNVIPPQNPNTSDVNQAIANAFASGGSALSLRAVNWLCTPQLFTDNQFKSYLQNLDNMLKLNLRKNILNASDNPQNPDMSVKMAISNDGNLVKAAVSDSSGSEQIDNIVLQSINETFQGEKTPILTDSPLKSDIYYLKVIIKL